MEDTYKQDLISKVIPAPVSKSQRTRFHILESAILNFATIGYEQTSYEKIAQTAKLSRPLVMR